MDMVLYLTVIAIKHYMFFLFTGGHVAEWLVLSTLDHGVPGLSPDKGKIQSKPKGNIYLLFWYDCYTVEKNVKLPSIFFSYTSTVFHIRG